MSGILFLTLDEVFELHLKQIELFGGSAGLRDRGLLESAIAQPGQTFGGAHLHEDIAAMAAAYLFHIVSNHPFVDGNKRTGFLVGVLFLEMNRARLSAIEEDATQAVLGLAAGTLDETAFAAWLRANVKKS